MNAHTPPTLESLMSRYLERQAEARELGLETGAVADVVPYEAGPVQPIDAKTAWDEATVPLKLFGLAAKMKAPPGWVQLVARCEPQVAVALGVGHFPQMVRDFHRLLRLSDALKPTEPGPALESPPEFLDWVDSIARTPKFPQALLALGGLRLARQFARAERFVQEMEAHVPAEARAAWDNEVAALAWHSGRRAEARALWLKQPASVPVRFNRALAALFLGDAATAGPGFEEVVGELPDSAAWHHLARLYHTLASMRG
jgi:hypothetical protein